METPEFDGRRADDLLEELKRLAAWYTPEWRPDERDPDAALALARLFAGMLGDTLRFGDARLHNHFLAFLNLTGGSLGAPISAEGLAELTVPPGSAGAEVPRGSVLYAGAENAEGRVYFETAEPIYAVSNDIEAVFLTDRASDRILRLFCRGSDQAGAELRLFDFNHGENRQEHVIYLENDAVFYAETRSELVLTFQNRYSEQNRAKLPLQLLKDVDWQYFDGAGWRTVAEAERYGGGIRLRFPGGAQPCELRGKTARFLRARFQKAPEEPLLTDGVLCAAQGAGLAPDALLFGAESLPQTDFLPFGEEPGLFGAFCVGCREAFGKPGARVELRFDLSFCRVPLGNLPPPPPVRYRGLMRREELLPPAPLELELEQVVWEYWNGLGWKRLDVPEPCGALFAASGPKGPRTLSFPCPADMEEVSLGAERSRFLRARPVRVGRAAALGDLFLAPVIHRAAIGYRYGSGPLPPARVLTLSGLDWREPALPAPQAVPLLGDALCPRAALYLRLREPLSKGPVSILVELQEQVGAPRPPLRWEYYGADGQGRGSFRPLPVRDGTEHLSHTGVVTLEGRRDFAPAALFGETGYYLRLVDETGGYGTGTAAPPPVLLRLGFNAAPIVQRDRRRPERFTMANQEANQLCRLPAAGLCGAAVWVDELSARSARERSALALGASRDVRTERDASGRLNRLWVRWREVERLALAPGDARVYELDARRGLVRFGDGVHGAIPPPGETVLVEYGVSAGAEGNLAPRALAGFARSAPGRAGAANPKALHGGWDGEDAPRAERRLNGARNACGRTVTALDLEEALACADPNIRAVRCAPHTDRLGGEAPGVLSVAILPRGFRRDRAAFAALERRARALLAPRLPASLTELSLFEADYLEVSVSAELAAGADGRAAAEEALRRYLDPAGWNLGALPTRTSLRRLLEGVAGVEAVGRLDVFARAVTEEGARDTELEDAPRALFTVPVCGALELTII